VTWFCVALGMAGSVELTHREMIAAAVLQMLLL
jgi:hypothetical protein